MTMIRTIKSTIRRIQFAWRKMTSSQRSLPDFLIIGTQKGGTTSLYSYLVQHPKIAPVLTKEIHYFDGYFTKGLAWYKAHFPLALRMKGKLTGEATPYYLYHPHAAKRAAELVPNAKLVILLRNPVERAYSHYNMGNRLNIENRESFEEAVEAEEGRIREDWNKMIADPGWESSNVQNYSLLDRGRYLAQIKRWEAHFPREQMLILSSEDFFHDPAAVTRKVWGFLGAPDYPLQNKKAKNIGVYSSKISEETYQNLEKQFQQDNEALFQHLGQHFDW